MLRLIRKFFRGVLLLLGLGILGAIFARSPFELTQLKIALLSPKLVALNFALGVATLFVGSLRWVIICRSLGLSTRLGEAVRGSFVGGLVGSFIPTAAGSDLGRFSICFLSSGQKRAGAISIFFDRAWGVSSLMLVLGASQFWENSLQLDVGTRSVLLAIGVSGSLVTMLLQFLIGHEWLQGVLAQWGMSGIRTPTFFEWLSCLLLGLLNTVVNCYIYQVNAEALSIHSSLWPFLAIVPLGALGSALSFIPYGLGVSQVLFHELFRWSGVSSPDQGVVVASLVQAFNFAFHTFAVFFIWKRNVKEGEGDLASHSDRKAA